MAKSTHVACAPASESALTDAISRLSDEIGAIVSERQALRGAGANTATLESNRRRLATAQAELSRLLIERHAPHATARRPAAL